MSDDTIYDNSPSMQVDEDYVGEPIGHEELPTRTDTILPEAQIAGEAKAREELMARFRDIEALLSRVKEEIEARTEKVVIDARSTIDYVLSMISRKMRSL